MRLNKMYTLLSVVLLAVTLSLVRAGLVFSKGGFLPVSSSSIHQGDLVLTGNTVYTIEGRFDINGSIIVKENATLILKNAVVNFTQTRNYEFKMLFEKPSNGNPRLEVANSTLTSKFIFYAGFQANSSATVRELNTFKCALEAFDSSTVSVFNSTMNDLWAYESSVLTVANSTITSTLRGSGYATVSASNCTIKYVDTWWRPNITISHSTVTYHLKPCFRSVNSSVAGLKPSLFQSWNSLQDFSLIEAAEGFAPNITLLETQVLGWSLRFLGSSNATVYNSTLRYLNALDSSTVNVYNSTYLYGYIYDSARVYVSWYLDVHVIDSENTDVPAANVTATWTSVPWISMMTGVTDANGWVRLTLMEKMMNATGSYPVGNYTITATYEAHTRQKSVNMTGNKEITVSLPFIIPEFPTALLLPILIIIALVAVILTKRQSRKTPATLK